MPSGRFDTHAVTNQSPPYVDVDLFATDRPLQDAVAANGGDADANALSAFGRRWGSAEMFDLGRLANENPPKLHAFDAKGFRQDTVEFHPAYHLFMTESMGARLHASTWRADATAAAPPALASLAQDVAGLMETSEATDAIADALSAREAERGARAAVERLALLAAAAALRHAAPSAVAESFARARFAAGYGAMRGTADLDADAIARLLERALPQT